MHREEPTYFSVHPLCLRASVVCLSLLAAIKADGYSRDRSYPRLPVTRIPP
jgi:hypothetical protein